MRAAKRYARDYGPKGDWTRLQPCDCTGKRTGEYVTDPILGRVLVIVVAAHFPGRGAGGHSEAIIPLALHLEKRGHRIGYKAVEKAFGKNFKQLAKQHEAHWQKIASQLAPRKIVETA